MRRENTFKVPNQLICDGDLSYTARRMGVVLYSRINRLGACRKSLNTLAWLACCTVATAHKAIVELERAGYLTRSRGYRYDTKLQRSVYDWTTYHCPLISEAFTLIPRRVFQHALSASSFVLCIYLFQQAGNDTRAFPSIRCIGDALTMGRSTVCRCLQLLRKGALWLVQSCRRLRRDLACNSYHLLHSAECSPTGGVTPMGRNTLLERARQLAGYIRTVPLHLLNFIRTATRPASLFWGRG